MEILWSLRMVSCRITYHRYSNVAISKSSHPSCIYKWQTNLKIKGISFPSFFFWCNCFPNHNRFVFSWLQLLVWFQCPETKSSAIITTVGCHLSWALTKIADDWHFFLFYFTSSSWVLLEGMKRIIADKLVAPPDIFQAKWLCLKSGNQFHFVLEFFFCLCPHSLCTALQWRHAASLNTVAPTHFFVAWEHHWCIDGDDWCSLW
jgi:hypothetical protein